MFLGERPRKPGRIMAGTQNFNRKEMTAYIRRTKYDDAASEYFFKHVFQGPTSALGNTDDWLEDFYEWQRKEIDHEVA